MLHIRFIRRISFVIAALAAACIQSTDPGMDKRYATELTAPDYLAGKKFRWPSMPIRIKYNACGSCSAEMEDAVKRGIGFWERNASLFGEIQTVFADTGDINVTYVPTLADDVIATCGASIGQLSGGQYVLVRPMLLQIARTVNGPVIDPAKYEFVAAHEIGHCLGLWEHSPQNGDLMYAYLTNLTNFTARDLNSLRWLYSQKPDIGIYPPMTAGLTLTGTLESTPLLWK